MKKNLITSACLFFLLGGNYTAYADINDLNIMQCVRNKENIIPVVVLGSGPAGLCAALFTARANFATTIFMGDNFGGQIAHANAIENWPGREKSTGLELIQDLKNQAISFGAEIVPDTVVSVDFSEWPFTLYTQEEEELRALAVIITTGGRQRTADIPGMQEFWGKGVGVCTLCDAPFDKGKNVAIVGDNDMAVDKALHVAQFAKQVIVLVESNEMAALPELQNRLRATNNIEIMYNTRVNKILGATRVTGVEITQLNEQTQLLPVESVYFSLGFDPNSATFSEWLEMDENEYILVYNGTQQTSIPGVFAAGTVEDTHYQKAIIAGGRGAQAGMDAIHFLENKGLNQERRSAINAMSYKCQRHAAGFVELIKTEEEFNKKLKENHLLVVDFFITSCPDCIRLEPIFETVAHKFQDNAGFAKINYDESSAIVEKYEIEEVPCIMIFKDGVEIHRWYEDKITRKQLTELVEKYL